VKMGIWLCLLGDSRYPLDLDEIAFVILYVTAIQA